MSLPTILKIAPYLAAVALLVGVFFYGVNVGKGKQKIIYQDRIIEASNRHAKIEKKQSEIIANRDNVNIIDVLYKGNF